MAFKQISFHHLREKLETLPHMDLNRIEKAYLIAEKAHEGQKRKSGEEYIEHPLSVAYKLAHVHSDENSIIAALLHDTVEDTEITLQEIEEQFGHEVAVLVDGLTKITQHKFRSTENLERKIESLRKWLETMQTDIRVAVIKLFDRLHNMETLEWHSPEKQKLIAQETLDIYAKIAYKLGMNDLRYQLEELALKFLDADELILLQKIQKRERIQAAKIQKIIENQLLGSDPTGKIRSITYEPLSLLKLYQDKAHEKQTLKGLIPAVFIVTTRNIEDCYHALFLIHSLWKGKKGLIRDYISSPTSNGCQQISTIVLFDGGQNVLFKIRTEAMDMYFKEGITRFCFSKTRNEQNILWIKNLAYVTDIETQNSKNFLEKFHHDIMGASIIIYTDQDEPIMIPEYATALDAALYLYNMRALRLEEIFIDGFPVPLEEPLKENSQIQFSFGRKNTVNRKWLEWSNTALAYSLIQKGLKRINK